MVTKPTVLILGAGASKPLGYPTGVELKKGIFDDLETDMPCFTALRTLGFSAKDISDFRWALFYSGKNSVDAFLEHRKDFLEIGKFSIASALLSYENERELFEIGDWYQFFYDKLNTSFEEFDKNTISIITFNYDRSLEHYLFTALKHSYDRESRECASKLKNIPIIHVHGQLGYLPWQDHLPRPLEPWRGLEDWIRYGSPTDTEDLKRAVEGIRIIHDDKDLGGDPQFDKAHELLAQAEKVYFLGFGYHATNVERLNIELLRKTSRVDVQGTIKGLGEAEKDTARNLFDHKGVNINFFPGDVLDFFKQRVLLQ